ncbi:hypothetical protein Glove_340g11 [Diversispora epigaea]|uniref:Uncharacterized protein n=1 Tax=Diversispora epigaea TaxID=1348612 RepID=A0A397HK88_9GLOM|nr:hypothetical protein Glove_340g11 [Diversispora epigaea]
MINSRREDKDDDVLCQGENATILYEQSFGPAEFDSAHYIKDITKLARNGVDNLNHHFLQYKNSFVTTLKSIDIRGFSRCFFLCLALLIVELYKIYTNIIC